MVNAIMLHALWLVPSYFVFMAHVVMAPAQAWAPEWRMGWGCGEVGHEGTSLAQRAMRMRRKQ